MARKPNYKFDRLQRERAKAEKKAAKAEEKRLKKEADESDDASAVDSDPPLED